MNLKDFSDQHNGIKAIVRRHFDYEPVLATQATQGGGYGSLAGALIYTRVIDPAKLGLSTKGVQGAINQGRKLAEMGIMPSIIICGIDQRNLDGARHTAGGIKEVSGEEIHYFTSPAVTYPHYRDPHQLSQAIDKYGDYIVHRYLAEREEVAGLWSEPASVFEARVVSAVMADYPEGAPVLFDLNFEQLVLLHFLHVEKIKRSGIPIENAWCPTKGGGIVYGVDGQVAEFTPELEIIQ